MAGIAELSIWAAGTLGAVLFFGSIAAEARSGRARAESEALTQAVEAMRTHIAALGKLDDPAMPADLLELAIGFSKALFHPLAPRAIEKALAINPNRFDGPGLSDEDYATDASFRVLMSTRPDLAASFTEAMVSGMTAFSLRWPKCSRVFQKFVIEVAAHPTKEPAHVVRWAKEESSYGMAQLAPAH